MYDPLKNHRLGAFLSVQSIAIGADNYPVAMVDDGWDLWANNQLPNRMIIAIDVQSVGTNGTLDIIVQDSEDLVTWDVDFITAAQITVAGYYTIDVNDMHRYIRLNGTVATDAVVWGAYFITFEDQRRPVTQAFTALTLTYGTGRTPKVATS